MSSLPLTFPVMVFPMECCPSHHCLKRTYKCSRLPNEVPSLRFLPILCDAPVSRGGGSLPVYWLPHNAWVTAVLRTAAPVPLSPNWMTAILALGKG